ncbi:MAG: transcription antitermination factor NusB [Mariprofundales bacterium]|nr:transcription antitermination factor NusB [Mariprofundales bacterium]
MSNDGKRKSPRHGVNRHQARQSALEVLYAWHAGGDDRADVAHLLRDRIDERDKQDKVYLSELVHGVTESHAKIDAHIIKVLPHNALTNIGSIELAILRLACWELWQRLEIPYRVVLNEALELSHEYADDPAPGFVNGVLDRLARELRPQEVT